jgi:hypothetical protein
MFSFLVYDSNDVVVIYLIIDKNLKKKKNFRIKKKINKSSTKIKLTTIQFKKNKKK